MQILFDLEYLLRYFKVIQGQNRKKEKVYYAIGMEQNM